MGSVSVEIRLLGAVDVRREGATVELPPSKKTKGLLAYLVLTGRAHRRERLCSLLWDVADDPRAALRWSLSKLRAALEGDGATRICATREIVTFAPEGASVDLLDARQAAPNVGTLSTAALEALAGTFRGELLEGLDLNDFQEFRAWLVAEREEARRLHVRILRELLKRHRAKPVEAVPWARALAAADPLDEEVRLSLVRILSGAGRKAEALDQLEAARRLFRELGIASANRLDTLEGELQKPSPRHPEVAAESAAEATAAAPDVARSEGNLVGREAERALLASALESAAATGKAQLCLVTGEPGVGKTRLLLDVQESARAQGWRTLAGSSYEAESGRPYAPWIEVLRGVPQARVPSASRADLAALLPELGPSAEESGRERLYGAVSGLLADLGTALVTFDDAQWLDEASSALLSHVLRAGADRPLVVVLAARAGELPDNEPVSRLLRGARRSLPVHDVPLSPLSLRDTASLLQGLGAEADPGLVYRESAGNPLLVLEIVRGSRGEAPGGLARLVRDRTNRLPVHAESVLRWAAILGPAFRAERLEALVSLGTDELTAALQVLERHALIAARDPDGSSGYAFSHGAVHRVIYDDVSGPRRRLMHARAARALSRLPDPAGQVADELAYHAECGGDAALAVEACVTAGRRCLRVFANRQAEAFARRGLAQSDALDGEARAKRALELHEIRIAARRPEDPERAAREIEKLSEEALRLGCLEHARLGFHMLGYLKWEGGRWSDARRHMMRAELISRSTDPKERVVALAEAARCLLLLEADLGHAEALAREASALSSRTGVAPSAIPDALGMLRAHEGRYDEGETLFREALTLAGAEDHLAQFQPLSHLAMLLLEAGRYAEAAEAGRDLVELAGRLREGSELPFARALLAIARCGAGDDGQDPEVDGALSGLRAQDARHRLAWALNRAAGGCLGRGRFERARGFALEARDVAATLSHHSEQVIAASLLLRTAEALHLGDEGARHREDLARLAPAASSHEARAAAASSGGREA